MVEKTKFLFYYFKLRLTTQLGVHKTSNPVDREWRWKHWQSIKAAQQHRRSQENA